MCTKIDRKIIGVVEFVNIKGEKGSKRVKAKIDTGADRTNVDLKLASEIGLGPLTDTVKVRSSTAGKSETRPVLEAEIIVHQKHFSLPVSVDDRSKMRYAVLIGRDLLEESNFLIDPRKGVGGKIRRSTR